MGGASAHRASQLQNDKGPTVASETYLSFGRLVIAETPKLPPKRSSKPDAFAERVRSSVMAGVHPPVSSAGADRQKDDGGNQHVDL